MTRVGREKEYEALEQARHEATGAVIVGPAGVGKTYLARDFLAERHRAGQTIEHFHASESTQGVPFGALARIVGALTFPEPSDLSVRIATICDRLAGENPNQLPALFFDDANLLDEATLAVVDQLAASARATVWLTIRSGETIPAQVLGLWRANTIHRVDLEPLERPKADALAELVLDGQADKKLLDALWTRTTGTPLYIRETVTDALAGGSISRPEDEWTIVSPLRTGRRVQDLLHHRLERLEPAERSVLEVIAAVEPVAVDLLTESEEALVHDLERRGVVQWEDPEKREIVQSGHPLLGEVTRSAMTAARTMAIRAILAERLLSLDSRPHGAALRLANAPSEQGEDLPVHLLVAAAREALGAFQPEQAEALARRAVAVERCCESHHALGDVLQLTGDIDAADRHLTTALELATDDTTIVRIAHKRSTLHGYLKSDPRTAVAILQAAAPRLQSQDAKLELKSETAVIAALLGRFPEVLETSKEILATEGIPDETRSITLGNVCYAQAMLIRLDDFDENWAEAASLLQADLLGEKPAEHDLLWAIKSSVWIERGDFVDGYAQLQAHLLECRESHRYRGIAEMISAHMLVSKGDTEALGAVERSLEQLTMMDPFSTTTLARAAGALAASLAGDLPRTDAYLEGLDLDAVADDPRAIAWLGRGLAARAALSGDLDEGAQVAAETGRRAVKGSQLGWGALALHDAVRLGRPELVVDELSDVLADTGAIYMDLLRTHAIASNDADASRLRDVAVQFARMGAWLHAGEAWLDVARLSADPTEQRNATVNAQLIAAQCSLNRWPQWATVDPVLSPREVDVSVLAVAGRPSREIAEELFVSTRTVDNHLGHVYKHLDLRGRDELTAAFAPTLVNREE